MNEIRLGRIDGTENNQIHLPIKDVTEGNYKATDVEVIGSNHTVDEDVWHPYVYIYSSHRDGTIYKNEHYWDSVFLLMSLTVKRVTNNSTNVIFSEAQVEPMRFSVTKRCKPDPENCQYHLACGMMQVFSLKLAKTTTNSGPIQLYGYIAARDVVDSMLNYVFNRSRDDPIVVQQAVTVPPARARGVTSTRWRRRLLDASSRSRRRLLDAAASLLDASDASSSRPCGGGGASSAWQLGGRFAEGSIIEMTGPKRGIGMGSNPAQRLGHMASRFEPQRDSRLEKRPRMRTPPVAVRCHINERQQARHFLVIIKNGEKEEDDLQLIDGIIELDDTVVTMIRTLTTFRLSGDCGSVDMSMAIFENAVEATVEVAISELHYGFDLSISYVLSDLKESREFKLFGDTIGESCGLRRFVIAVNLDTLMHLKFKAPMLLNIVAPLNLSYMDAPVKK
uniref:DUF6598 domain-containing protein n=1 Tax=Oryza meridionalis TaxID=40149 RepID=A0A0E0CV42_9ORYZ